MGGKIYYQESRGKPLKRMLKKRYVLFKMQKRKDNKSIPAKPMIDTLMS